MVILSIFGLTSWIEFLYLIVIYLKVTASRANLPRLHL